MSLMAALRAAEAERDAALVKLDKLSQAPVHDDDGHYILGGEPSIGVEDTYELGPLERTGWDARQVCPLRLIYRA